MIDAEVIETNTCDFCKKDTAKFVKVYDEWGIGNWYEGVDGSGSDWLATWCKDCGPQHRKER